MIERIIHTGTPEEARAAAGAGTAYLAGGTEINRLGSSVCADTLIDLRHLTELKRIAAEKDGVRIGALAVFQDVLEHPLTPDWFRESVSFMASRTKRNMATIGGNLSLRRDDSYLMPALMAAGARITLLGPDGIRETDAASFAGEDRTGDLILSVLLPSGAAVRQKRYANTAESHAYLTVAAAETTDGIHLAAGIRGTGLRMLDGIAGAIRRGGGSVTDESLTEQIRADESLPVQDDFSCSAAYKTYLLAVTCRDLLRVLPSSSEKKGGDPA